MALEDARDTGQDIYSIQVDFCSAFNTLDHDRLLQTMYDLGFPTDSIDVVLDLYSGATTEIKIGAFGMTEPIPMDRGNIQGDSLSPLLFLIYIEPLLRWLQVGGRGHMFGCMKDQPDERILNSLSGAAYADDLAILTNNLSNLKIQAEKVSMYSDWAHMIVNDGKTKVTGVLYHSIEAGHCSKGEAMRRVRAQLENQIFIQRKQVGYLDPRDPFRYLGANLTMTLDWRYQHQTLALKAKEKID